MADEVQDIDLGRFAETEDAADARYATTRSADPFPEIEPALLNSADLIDYVAATGMIYPFNPLPPDERVKPASYAVPLLGSYLYYEDRLDPTSPDGVETQEVFADLAVDEELLLKRNSIVYITLEPTFRMPDYLAARFNLKIRDIYRGILVGTGPLVDPGFVGRLSVPLHNLTANDYRLVGGEPLVWMEFTKISRNERWHPGHERGEDRKGVYVAFPDYKRERETVRNYVRHAHPGPIMSSIPKLLGRAEASAVKAADSAKVAADRTATVRNQVLAVSVAGLLAVVIGGYQLFTETVGVVDDTRDVSERVDQKLTRTQSLLRNERAVNKRQTRQLRSLARKARTPGE